MTTPFKTCTICGEVKPVTDFNLRRKNEHIRRSECKQCQNSVSHHGRKYA